MNELFRKMLFLPEQASTMAFPLDRLHYFVITTTMLVSALIGLIAVGFYVKYRWKGRRLAKGEPVYTTWQLEVLIIGTPTVFFLLWFWIGFRDFIRMKTPPENSMDVYVMAKQWMWKFSYPEGPNGVNVLHVPADRPVRLLMTSRDVIHSFYVPAFRIKQDVLPGRYTQTWFEATKPGIYQVLCTEYCGTGHSIMRAEVVVHSPEDFQKWLAEQKEVARPKQRDGAQIAAQNEDPHATMVTMGRQLAVSAGCLKCHSIDGTAHIGPTWLDLYRRKTALEDGTTIVADEAYITESMMYPNAKHVKSFAVPSVMPSYQGRLEGPESAAIVEFIKSLRSGQPENLPTPGPIFDEKAGQTAQPGSGEIVR
jgi:cytochrome c oxidase subunit II